MSVFAVVLTWNKPKDAKECIESLLKSSLPPVEVIVVDNSSPNKRVVEILKKFFGNTPQVRFIENPENYGFAKGMNTGIQEALRQGAEYIVLVNDDAVVDEKCLEVLCAAATEDPSIGIVGPRILYYNEPERIWHGGGYFSFLKSGPIVPEKNRVESACSLNQYDVDFLTGCVVLVKRKVFETIGLLDEDYFLYSEDLDFCLRAKKAGFKIAVEPKSIVIHKLKEGKKKPLWQRWQLVKSNLIFINRWIDWWKRPLAWGFWLVRGIKILIG